MCYDPLCLECNGFNSSCSVVKPNSHSVNNSIICNSGYYQNYSDCIACIGNSTVINNTCVCNDGFWFNLNIALCSSCYENCKSCTGINATDCLICQDGFYNISGYCMLCPTGYYILGSLCTLKDKFIFDLKLISLKGLLYDTRSNIPILTGNSEVFYPNYDSEDPNVSYLQGYYFNGISSILRLPNYKNYTTPILILGPIWIIEIWFLPYSLQGCLLYSSNIKTLIYAICLIDSHIYINITIASYGVVTASSVNSLQLNSWNKLGVSLNANTASFYINCLFDSSTNLLGTLFFNNSANIFTNIGSGNNNFYFQGFIYQISIFSDLVYTSSSLNSDSICLKSIFLSECLIDSYWIGPNSNDCGKCLNTCTKGCRTNNSCSLCLDPACKDCSDINSTNCKECTENANSILTACQCNIGYKMTMNSLCIICPDNYYIDGDTCKSCPNLCTSCNSNGCLNCVTNAALIQNNCICNDGYNGTDSCDLICKAGYYSNITNCVKCLNLCMSCSNDSDCTSCVSNGILINNSCICSNGLNDNNSCNSVGKNITALLEVTSNNNLILIFSESLARNITESDIFFMVFNNLLSSYSVERWSVCFLVVVMF